MVTLSLTHNLNELLSNFSHSKTLSSNHQESINRLPFVVTYNPSLPHISNILRKHFHILLSSKRCREVFKHPPIVAYRRTSNLRDILVKAKLPTITTPNNTSLPDRVHSTVDKIVLLVLTLLTVLHAILSSLLAQPVKLNHT